MKPPSTGYWVVLGALCVWLMKWTLQWNPWYFIVIHFLVVAVGLFLFNMLWVGSFGKVPVMSIIVGCLAIFVFIKLIKLIFVVIVICLFIKVLGELASF